MVLLKQTAQTSALRKMEILCSRNGNLCTCTVWWNRPDRDKNWAGTICHRIYVLFYLNMPCPIITDHLIHVHVSDLGWTLTYFETCPFGQVRAIFTCPNWKCTCPHFWSGTHWQYFLFLQLHKRGLKFYLSRRTSGVGISVVRQVFSVVPGSQTSLNVHPCWWI